MKNFYKQLNIFNFILFFLILFIILLIIRDFYHRYNSKHIEDYMSIIESQEEISDDILITEQDWKKINLCFQKNKEKRNSLIEECIRDFYKQYSLKNGIKEGFDHLARLLKEHPEMLPSCHYVSHGIGHASLILNKGDVYKSFDMMGSNLFKNIATCGNGYFHGVIEEYAKDIKTKEELLTTLKKVCNSSGLKKNGNCYHGVGHATLIQLDYNVEDSLFVCKNLSNNPARRFECYTGVFMEYAQLLNDYYFAKDGKITFTMCDAVEKEYRAACYLEQSSIFERHSQEPRNYVRNIGFCKQISDPLNRMACIKLNAIRAVRISHYKEIEAMCKNTSSISERIICTSISADRIGGSIDFDRKSEIYFNAVKDVCMDLPIYYQYLCFKIAVNRDRSFYTQESDLMISNPINIIRELYFKENEY